MYCRYVPTDNKWKRRARLLTRIPTKLSFPLHLCFPYEESTQASISHTPYNKATQIQTRVNIEHTETYQASASDKKKKKDLSLKKCLAHMHHWLKTFPC